MLICHSNLRHEEESSEINFSQIVEYFVRRSRSYWFRMVELRSGDEIVAGDVDGSIRMAAADNQLSLPDMGSNGMLAMAKIGTRKKTIQARTPTQDAYIRAMDNNELIAGAGKEFKISHLKNGQYYLFFGPEGEQLELYRKSDPVVVIKKKKKE